MLGRQKRRAFYVERGWPSLRGPQLILFIWTTTFWNKTTLPSATKENSLPYIKAVTLECILLCYHFCILFVFCFIVPNIIVVLWLLLGQTTTHSTTCNLPVQHMALHLSYYASVSCTPLVPYSKVTQSTQVSPRCVEKLESSMTQEVLTSPPTLHTLKLI